MTTNASHPITFKLSLSDKHSFINESDILFTTICRCSMSSPAIAQMAFIVVFFKNFVWYLFSRLNRESWVLDSNNEIWISTLDKHNLFIVSIEVTRRFSLSCLRVSFRKFAMPSSINWYWITGMKSINVQIRRNTEVKSFSLEPCGHLFD